MNTDALKEKWILANAEVLADVIITELEHYQRIKQKKIKSIMLDICSASIPIERAMVSFKPLHETRSVEYLISYGISNPLKDGEQVNFHFYEQNMKNQSGQKELTITMDEPEDYRDVIVAFLKNTMVY